MEKKSILAPGMAAVSEVKGLSMSVADSWREVCDKVRKQFPGRLVDVRMLQHGASVRCLQASGSTEASPEAATPRYNMGCIQALPEAVVLELLFAEGIVDPAAPLGDYLPELVMSGGRPLTEGIRVRDVLSHATGYHTPSKLMESMSFEEVVLYLQNKVPAFPPGTVCSWNNLGRHILEELVRRTTGKDVSQLIQELLHDVSVSEAVVHREKSGWLDIELSLDELTTFISRTLGPGGVGSALMTRVADVSVPVVRRPVSSRSGYPVAYAHGIARYPDKLWGQNGVGSTYTLGVRFNQEVSFLNCLAVEAGPFARDLVLQLLAGAAGYIRDPSPVHAVGAIVDCDIASLAGNYIADGEERITVAVAHDRIACVVLRGDERIASIPLSLSENNILLADVRWSTLQIEFFPHPESGVACLVLGQVCYVKSDAL